jgi:hypothetical protein
MTSSSKTKASAADAETTDTPEQTASVFDPKNSRQARFSTYAASTDVVVDKPVAGARVTQTLNVPS